MTSTLDPQISSLLGLVAKSGSPELYTLSPEQARELYSLNVKKLAGESPIIRGSIDKIIDCHKSELPIRIYRPDVEHNMKLPVVVFFHGGGWSFGSVDSHDHICRWLTAKSECIFVSVDYRMGPEHKFPAAVEDALMATQWVIDRASDFGADNERIAIAGDSAGANLATVVSLIMRDKNISSIRAQLLIYPATDMTMSFPSHRLFGEGYRLTRPLMVWCLANYLKDGRDMFDFRASPLFANDHSRLPPALIMTAGYDPLRDEGEAYANKLLNSGVPVEYICYEGMIHGFIGMLGLVDVAKSAILDASVYLKDMLYQN